MFMKNRCIEKSTQQEVGHHSIACSPSCAERWRCCHVNSTAEVADNQLRLTYRAMRRHLTRDQTLGRHSGGGTAFIVAEVACEPAAIDAWTAQLLFSARCQHVQQLRLHGTDTVSDWWVAVVAASTTRASAFDPSADRHAAHCIPKGIRTNLIAL